MQSKKLVNKFIIIIIRTLGSKADPKFYFVLLKDLLQIATLKNVERFKLATAKKHEEEKNSIQIFIISVHRCVCVNVTYSKKTKCGF